MRVYKPIVAHFIAGGEQVDEVEIVPKKRLGKKLATVIKTRESGVREVRNGDPFSSWEGCSNSK